MGDISPDRTELFIRYYRRSLMLVLVVLALLTLWLCGGIFFPGSAFRAFSEHLVTPFPLLPLLLIFAAVMNARDLKGKGVRKDDPDVRAVLEDEHRRANLHRALRAAFVVTLVAQMPLALLFVLRPMPEAPLYMGALTLSLGLMALVAAFLVFDRE
ncbi:MAG TPA: hypothetical protein VJ600_05350 [Holophagaceae bacterium]|nr:hypothetical protein [Holophagaceae bacterium]